MSDEESNGFGVITIEMNIVDQEQLDKVLVVRSRIFEKTRVLKGSAADCRFSRMNTKTVKALDGKGICRYRWPPQWS